MHREIYLDNSATTRQYDEVTDLMGDIARNCYGNPSSLHTKGIEAERIVKTARGILAGSLGADVKEILITSGGTESNNLAIRGYLDANPRKGKHIITTKVEHPSVIEVCKHLETIGFRVDYLNVDRNGSIDLEELRRKICGETALISIIGVNNEVGTFQPLDEIINIKDSINPNTAVHVDFVQGFGKLAIQPGKSGIDLLSASSHKIHGPKGVGLLYVSRTVRIKPIFFGGGQESQLRSGTENVPGIAGFGLAVKMTCENTKTAAEKVTALKNTFLDMLQGCTFNCIVNSPAEDCSPYILNVSFPGVKSEVLLHHLEERNIFVSTGSACSSRKRTGSRVLTAMGLPPEAVDGAVRFSFSGFSECVDIENTVSALEDIIPRIQIKKRKTGGNT